MSGAKEIRSKIKSIKSTQKITRAMQMVAASKMRKAQQQLLAARPYALQIRKVIAHLAQGSSEYRHPYFTTRKANNIGVLVVSTDRGLCGGLNVNLFRHLVNQLQTWHEQKNKVVFSAIGGKATLFLRRLNVTLLASTRAGETPSMHEVIGPLEVMLRAFHNGEIDALYLYHNQFISTLSQAPQLKELLPISPAYFKSKEVPTTARWDYLYEPDPKTLLDLLLNRFMESQVYHGLVENFACEQAARMMAMRSATDNAGDLIDNLQLAYNKARQAAITQELAEIVSGAAAV